MWLPWRNLVIQNKLRRAKTCLPSDRQWELNMLIQSLRGSYRPLVGPFGPAMLQSPLRLSKLIRRLILEILGDPWSIWLVKWSESIRWSYHQALMGPAWKGWALPFQVMKSWVWSINSLRMARFHVHRWELVCLIWIVWRPVIKAKSWSCHPVLLQGSWWWVWLTAELLPRPALVSMMSLPSLVRVRLPMLVICGRRFINMRLATESKSPTTMMDKKKRWR